MVREEADQINQVAADWVARADRGLTVAEQARLDAWLKADSRRAGAYMRMTAALESSDLAPAVRPSTSTRDRSRRQWLAGAGAVAASLGFAVVYGVTRPQRFDTRKGEKKVVTLDDGSIVTLNTATTLQVRFSDSRRSIRLVDGEALFDVAPDPARPFVVTAADTSVRAVGTSFTVTQVRGQPVRVLVRHGTVEVSRTGQTALVPMRLTANTKAVVPETTAPVVVSRIRAEELDRELAWQQGRLVFAGESLSSAAAQFARYSDIRIIVSDPDLAREGVAGVFDSSDPVGFAQAVALSLNAHAEIRQSEVRIVR